MSDPGGTLRWRRRHDGWSARPRAYSRSWDRLDGCEPDMPAGCDRGAAEPQLAVLDTVDLRRKIDRSEHVLANQLIIRRRRLLAQRIYPADSPSRHAKTKTAIRAAAFIVNLHSKPQERNMPRIAPLPPD